MLHGYVDEKVTLSATRVMSASAHPPEFADHPFVISLPVQWGDQDAFGHVNNVIYFRWMESARIAYFDKAGLAAAEGLDPILASIACDFRDQLTYPDTLLVSASITSIGRTSLKMVHRVYSTTQKKVAAEGTSTLVMFNYDAQRSVPVSDEDRAKIEVIEGHPIPATKQQSA